MRTRTAVPKPLRLELACGHIAYALAGEPSRRGQRRPCQACGRSEQIVKVG